MGLPAERLDDGLWRLSLRTPTLPPATATNTLIVVGDEVAVVEPASPHREEQARLDACLASLAAEGRPLAYIVVTHHHRDHVGDVARLRARHGGQVVAHAQTARRVDFEVDRIVAGGDGLELGGGPSLEFTFTPGHAPGHLVVELPRTGWAHVGDLVASEGTILVDPHDDGDMAAYLDSLELMRARAQARSQRWVPAHGAAIEDPVALAEFYVRHRLGRERKILESLSFDRPSSPSKLLERAYDDKPPEVLPLARGALAAHLNKLLAEGRVREVPEGLLRVREGTVGPG